MKRLQRNSFALFLTSTKLIIICFVGVLMDVFNTGGGPEMNERRRDFIPLIEKREKHATGCCLSHCTNQHNSLQSLSHKKDPLSPPAQILLMKLQRAAAFIPPSLSHKNLST